MGHLGLVLAFLSFVTVSRGFYIPGVAPREFRRGELLDIRVKLLSFLEVMVGMLRRILFNAHHVMYFLVPTTLLTMPF